jgi:plastocyanin
MAAAGASRGRGWLAAARVAVAAAVAVAPGTIAPRASAQPAGAAGGAQPAGPAPATSSPARAAAGRVVGVVRVRETDGAPVPAADVIVYVPGFTEAPIAAGRGEAPVAATIEQRGRRFVPDLVAITAGERVRFPNGDPFLHNVFSQSPARRFDLGSFKRGESKAKVFPTLGVVDVYCNIHPEMAATILVLPNRRHTRAGADGRFVLDGIPPGTWTVFAYARRATRPASAQVKVIAGAEAAVELTVVRGPEVEHVNKYGAKYGAPAKTYRR